MLLAELLGEVRRRVSLVDNDALLLILTEIHIYKEQGWIGIIEIFIVTLTLIDLFRFCFFLVLLVSIPNLLLICVYFAQVVDNLRQLGALRYLSVSLLNRKLNELLKNKTIVPTYIDKI